VRRRCSFWDSPSDADCTGSQAACLLQQCGQRAG
jgi:hypothetical protein